MRVPVEIDSTEEGLAFELFDATTLAVGITLVLPGKAILSFQGVTRNTGAPHTVRLELGLEPDTSVREAAAWLGSRVAGRATELRVDGTAVDVDPAKIERALAQHVRKPA